jgi:hypothetical protein
MTLVRFHIAISCFHIDPCMLADLNLERLTLVGQTQELGNKLSAVLPQVAVVWV